MNWLTGLGLNVQAVGAIIKAQTMMTNHLRYLYLKKPVAGIGKIIQVERVVIA
jgi:hypothetical protein